MAVEATTRLILHFASSNGMQDACIIIKLNHRHPDFPSLIPLAKAIMKFTGFKAVEVKLGNIYRRSSSRSKEMVDLLRRLGERFHTEITDAYCLLDRGVTVPMGPSERDYDRDGFYYARYHPRARLSKRSS